MGLFDWMKGKRAPEPASRSAREREQEAADRREAEMSDEIDTVPNLSLLMPIPPAPTTLPGALQEGSKQSAGGLDFASAIQAHRNWKSRLAKYLGDESEELLDYRVVCRDDQCVLGKWINGRGANEYGHLPSFGELKVSHGQFHLAAGRIVQMHDDHQTVDAQQLLKHGDYSRYSIRVMGLLSTLYVEVSDTSPHAV